jgi:uncharacterized protein YutE (UPF0331/DUF86 family)
LEVNKNKLRKLVSELTDALRELEDLRNRENGEFLGNSHLVSSAKYNLLIAIEAAIDICNHVISRRRYRTPEDYADTFKVMGEAGVFPEEFLKNLIDMARFRNRLVHLYWTVDKREIYKILQDNLSDFEKFLQYLGKFVGEEIS